MGKNTGLKKKKTKKQKTLETEPPAALVTQNGETQGLAPVVNQNGEEKQGLEKKKKSKEQKTMETEPPVVAQNGILQGLAPVVTLNGEENHGLEKKRLKNRKLWELNLQLLLKMGRKKYMDLRKSTWT